MSLHNLLVEKSILIRGRIKHFQGRLVLEYKGKKLSFVRREWVSYPLNEIFVNNTYSRLGVKNRIVVDVGASIADSPIYFTLNGAKHVYGYEPDKNRYEMALENIKLNNMGAKITMYNKPYDGKHARNNAVIKIDCEGCEYSLVKNPYLKHFRELIMEYHNGSSRLVDCLSRSGFNSTVNEFSKDRGMLYAVKNEKSKNSADKL